jgi:electron transport complex, RnfABCDGE type, G subunit
MKENIKLGLILFLITAVAGLSLGFVKELTAAAIEANSKINSSDLAELLPGAVKVKDIKVEGIEEEKIRVLEAYEAYSNDETLTGHIFKTRTKGFHGAIDMVVAVDKNDKLSGIKIVEHTETPGLGARIVEEEFRKDFVGKEIASGIKMVKTETTKKDEVEAISGATVSSKAVGTGINITAAFYMEKIKGTKFETNGADADSGASEAAGEADKSEESSGATSEVEESGAVENSADGTSGASESK